MNCLKNEIKTAGESPSTPGMWEDGGLVSCSGKFALTSRQNINFEGLKGIDFKVAVWMDGVGNFENFMESMSGKDTRLVCLFFVCFFEIRVFLIME